MWKKLNNFMHSDKSKHMMANALLTFIIYHLVLDLWWAIIIVFLLGVVKEGFDFCVYNLFSFSDIGFNCLGIAFTSGFLKIMQIIYGGG